MQNGPLKLQHIVANPPDGGQKFRRGLAMRSGDLRLADPDGLSGQAGAVQLFTVPQHGSQTFAAHVRADLLDHLLRAQRAAEHLDRPLAAALADYVATGTQLLAQGVERVLHVALLAVDPLYV